MKNYNGKVTKAIALHCERLVNAQLTHIQYCKNVTNA